MQFANTQDWLQWILFFVLIAIFQFYANKLQVWKWMNDINNALLKLERYLNDASASFIEEASKYNKDRGAIEETLKKIKGYFLIEPVSLDPSGILRRLEHLLDELRESLDAHLTRLLPGIGVHRRADMRCLVEGIIILDQIYRVVRHYYILGKKTQNLIYIAQIQMQLPEILRIAKAYWSSGEAFRRGTPVGDSIGPLVALKLIGNSEVQELAYGTVGAEIEVEGRKVMVIKANGPGGEVGKPGEAIKRVIESRSGAIHRIIMIDAALKLEGELSAEIAEGVGAAIGDPGPEKWKIEDVAARYGIPLDSIVIKEDLTDAITIMKPEIAKAADEVVKRIKEAIVERTRPGDYVVVAGIGNSVGVGNREEI